MDKHEIIKSIIDAMENRDVIALHNAYCDAINYDDNIIENMDSFDEYFCLWDPEDLAEMIANSYHFDRTDSYFYHDGCGGVGSLLYWDDRYSPVDVDDIAEYILTYEEDLGFAKIAELLDAWEAEKKAAEIDKEYAEV